MVLDLLSFNYAVERRTRSLDRLLNLSPGESFLQSKCAAACGSVTLIVCSYLVPSQWERFKLLYGFHTTGSGISANAR